MKKIAHLVVVFFFLLFYAQTSLLTVLELKHTRFVRARADLIHAHARRVNDFAIDRERDVTGVRGGEKGTRAEHSGASA